MSPSLPASQGGHGPALQKRPGRVLGALPAAPATEEDGSICPITHSSSVKKVRGAPWGIWQRKAGCAARVATSCLLPRPSLKCFFLFPDLPLAKEKGVPVLCALAWREQLWAPTKGWDENGMWQMLQLQKCPL